MPSPGPAMTGGSPLRWTPATWSAAVPACAAPRSSGPRRQHPPLRPRRPQPRQRASSKDCRRDPHPPHGGGVYRTERFALFVRRKCVISFDSVDDDLRAARDRVRRLEQLTRQRQAVAVQLDEVGRLIGDLETGLAKEERDVSRLEGGGFAAFLSGLAGSKEEKLARERAE